MRVTITTGVNVAARHPEFTARSFTVTAPDHELDPDMLFSAANRVMDAPDDAERVASEYPGLAWLLEVRAALDANDAPSMSTGDTIDVDTDAGVRLGTWRCEAFGWSTRSEVTA